MVLRVTMVEALEMHVAYMTLPYNCTPMHAKAHILVKGHESYLKISFTQDNL